MGTYTWREPTTSNMRSAIQAHLKRLGRYSGPVDGIWGSNTVRGIQYSCQLAGLGVTVDGIPGPQTANGVVSYGSWSSDWPNVNGEYSLQDSHWTAFYNRLSNV